MTDYRSISLWMDTADDDLIPRAPLQGDIDADVAIVGAGYTGLWTAYYLKNSDPTLRVVIVEKEIAGFGASGRNGGWCSAFFAPSHLQIAQRYGRQAAINMQRAIINTIDEVKRVLDHERIDAHFEKGGTLTLATSPPQLERLIQYVDEEHEWDLTEDDVRWLPEGEARAMVDAEGSLGGAFTPHCAALHPARLARGLARSIERLGVTLYEQTPVTRIDPGHVTTPRGKVRAPLVVRATEGYTPRFGDLRRRLVPIYSLMIATEPLSDAFGKEVNWKPRVTVGDARHLIIYAQRTADDRIAFGGRGAPYHFGSRVEKRFDRDDSVFDELRRALVKLFPGAADAQITHRWGGPIGVPRDWFSSVGLDRSTGIAWAGGYVGDGVSTTNLAGRTLSNLLLEQDSDLIRLPWVNHRSPQWEPEPLRWMGINFAIKSFDLADRVENRTRRSAQRPLDVITRLIGL
jgi:glycine/D-amino acid oxidase-like deaminating enzyme